jgi:large subunit ribosomal protein L15
MQLHQLKPTHKSKKKKRIGRGGKRGTYSGRGVKGQKARAGARFQPAIRELIKKYPKLRGYRFNPKDSKIAGVNVGILEKNFKEKEEVNSQVLLNKGLIRKIKGKVPLVKILGKGEIKKALTIKGCQFSKQAKEKIEKAGGQIK